MNARPNTAADVEPHKRTAKPSANTTTGSKTFPARKAPPVFKRADLVGKFPHIKHLAAPKGSRRLDPAERELILASMLLV